MARLIRSYFICANEWYKFHNDLNPSPSFERDQTIRESLTETFIGAPHILGDVFYSLTKGNSSGNFATVHINGHANELIHRYAFSLMSEQYDGKVRSFTDHVNLATYGDDSLTCVSDECAPFFNGLTLGPIFKDHFGMTYTSANKNSELVALREKHEVDFCKRKFFYNKDVRRVVGTLPVSGLLEITNWIKVSVDDGESTLANVEAAHRELFLYGRSTYEAWSKKFAAGCASVGLLYDPPAYRSLQNDFFKNEL